MTLPTDGEVREYIKGLKNLSEYSHYEVNNAIVKYTEWLREREGSNMKCNNCTKNTSGNGCACGTDSNGNCAGYTPFTVYDEFGKLLDEKLGDKIDKYAVRERTGTENKTMIKDISDTMTEDDWKQHTIIKNKPLSDSILAFYKTVTGKTDATYKDIVKEYADISSDPIGDLMWKGEIKMDNNFPSFGKVFAEVNKLLWNKEAET